MEFKAIVDVKARESAGCAVVGVYENGDLGIAARRIDTQTGGLIGRLHAGGDFAGKLGRDLVAAASRRCRRRARAAGRLGPPLKFRPQAIPQGVAGERPRRSPRRARPMPWSTLRSRPWRDLDIHTRARTVSEVYSGQSYKIPDLKTAPKPKPAKLATVSVAAENARAVKSAERGLSIGLATSHGMSFARDLANLPPNVCTPTYMGKRAQALAKEWPSIKTKVLDENAIKALKMGAFLAVTQGSAQPPRLIVCEYRGGPKGSAPDLPGRQGHHLRFGRHLPEGPAGDGRDEVRHVRRRDGARRVARGGRT